MVKVVDALQSLTVTRWPRRCSHLPGSGKVALGRDGAAARIVEFADQGEAEWLRRAL